VPWVGRADGSSLKRPGARSRPVPAAQAGPHLRPRSSGAVCCHAVWWNLSSICPLRRLVRRQKRSRSLHFQAFPVRRENVASGHRARRGWELPSPEGATGAVFVRLNYRQKFDRPSVHLASPLLVGTGTLGLKSKVHRETCGQKVQDFRLNGGPGTCECIGGPAQCQGSAGVAWPLGAA
jgi:hypothetical protein